MTATTTSEPGLRLRRKRRENRHEPASENRTKAPGAEVSTLGSCTRLDYELEVGIFISRPNIVGDCIPMSAAEDHVFGVELFNDWSARHV